MDVERAVEVLRALVHAHRDTARAVQPSTASGDGDTGAYPGLDLPKALQMWRDEDKYKRFLKRFVAEYGDLLAHGESLTQEGRAALIHKLAGAAGSLALTDLALAARTYGEIKRAGGALEPAQQALDLQIAVAWGSAQRYLGQGAAPAVDPVSSPPGDQQVSPPAGPTPRVQALSPRPILVVDDEPANLAVMGEILSGEYPVVFAATGREALEAAKKYQPSMVLLDVQLPDISGHEVCRQLMQDPASRDTIVLFVTSMSARTEEEFGFALGAVDYIVKPISPSIVRARVKAHLSLVRLDRLQQSYSEAISMLGEAAHFNDEDTGVHIWRMAAYSRALAQAAGQDADFCGLLEPAASMHDTGKIGIPQAILKKPGPLDGDEWKVMRTHSQLGHDILSRGTSRMFVMAASIALAHHEKWDGSGYPKGLRGEAIPIEARLVAIADVFDALTARRPYKEPWSSERAFAYVQEARGQHFDPALVDVFLGMRTEIEQIRQFWAARENILLEAPPSA
jgi:putative two-component system response regulator